MQDDELVQVTFHKGDLGYLVDAVRSFRSILDNFYEKNPAYWNPFRTEVFSAILDKLEVADAATQVTFSGIEIRYLQRAISAATWDGQDEERCTVLKAIADELERQSA